MNRVNRIVKVRPRKHYDALARLNSFLDKNSPELVRFLVNTWQSHQNAVSYKELRKAVLHGALTWTQLDAWEKDYAVFFNKYLKSRLINAYTAGGKDLTAAYLAGDTVYAPMLTGIDKWISAHGAEWVTIVGQDQKDAIAAMIRYAATGNMTVDEASLIIRPLIGLNRPQSIANLNFYNARKKAVKEQLLKDNPAMKEAVAERRAAKKAREAAVRYAARQHRYRAEMISVTELAFAYNKGADDAVHAAVDANLLPPMKAQWVTAADERVCGICGELDGVTVPLGETFDFAGRDLYPGHKAVPPAHPWCRCALAYIEDDAYADTADFASVDGNSGLKPADDSGTIQEDGNLTNGISVDIPVTDEAIQRVPELDVFGDKTLNKLYRKANRDLLREVQSHPEYEPGTEFCAVYDQNMMRIKGFENTQGTIGKVKIPDPEIPHHAFHNHGSDGVLSFQDIIRFASVDTQLSITAVGNNGKAVFCLCTTPYSNKELFIDYLRSAFDDIIYVVQGRRFTLRSVNDLAREGKKVTGLSAHQEQKLYKAITRKTLEILEQSESEMYGFKFLKHSE